jgi:hypothetical protein
MLDGFTPNTICPAHRDPTDLILTLSIVLDIVDNMQ